jgi:threonine dehydrogenase-like Zn-dependent dehydrogenase
VEPGGNALRAFKATGLVTGERLLVLGTGTIGLLVALFARAGGVEVHLMGLGQERHATNSATISSSLARSTSVSGSCS